jgi:hypothetical protein
MKYDSDGYFKYTENHEPDWELLRNTSKIWIDYHIQELGIGVDPGDLHITTMAGIRKQCYSDEGECPTRA